MGKPSEARARDAIVLIEAAGIIRRRWQQGDFGNIDEAAGGRCALAAIAEAAFGRGIPEATFTGPAMRLAAHLGLPDYVKIARWNNEPGRTADDVAGAMEALAAKLTASAAKIAKAHAA